MNKKVLYLLVALATGFTTSVAVAEAPTASAVKQSSPELLAALSSLQDQVRGEAQLTPAELSKVTALVLKDARQLGTDATTCAKAFELVELYETRIGPLFMNAATKGGFPRTATSGLELHYALFAIQQALLDFAYTPENLEKRAAMLTGKSFKTAEYFPGKVTAPSDPSQGYDIQINASQPEAWGFPVAFQDVPARRPTGCYLAPGSISTVTVPPALVGKGFTIRVGAQSWDLAKKPKIKRLDRVSLVFPITRSVTPIANPLGGGIYIEVPYKASAGLVSVKITNAVRSPFFSARSFSKTSMAEWKSTERLHPGPWADFESDKFMMQVPAAWIRDLEDPVTLMRDWDQSMDAVSELLGLPLLRPKTVLYMQNDVLYRGTANFPGYPMSNDPYNPDQLAMQKAGASARKNYMIRGPQFAPYTTFHELGHATSLTKFKGETESAVNVPFVAVLNRKFGVDLEQAFGRSLGNGEKMNLDQAALTWMVTDHFQQGKPMVAAEMMYQHRGHAKYVDIVKLFGWEALSAFWHSVQVDYSKGIEYPKNDDPTDSRILRMSKAAKADLTPLLYFWGIHPDKPEALQAQLAQAGLKPSGAIYDRLRHYQSIIPMNHDAYLAHFQTLHPAGSQTKEKPLDDYQERNGLMARQVVQDILSRYFPMGRP
ncbi:M60 family metallopeptidase [Armatimonas rosea]|uniref:Peptidase M60 domain-containing protein n=1 Tax=Armatimonas rosea TaxID=685828 RepID=A0A7W9SW99_ARMRO|nr:M60 family metallopeptidase [Armatimonas rosea]MBB6054027.1 hypothetical protein [Armatimonas rosea]